MYVHLAYCRNYLLRNSHGLDSGLMVARDFCSSGCSRLSITKDFPTSPITIAILVFAIWHNLYLYCKCMSPIWFLIVVCPMIYKVYGICLTSICSGQADHCLFKIVLADFCSFVLTMSHLNNGLHHNKLAYYVYKMYKSNTC